MKAPGLKIVPHRQRTLEGPHAEAELARLRRRFRSITRRHERAMFVRRFYRKGRWWALTVACIAVLSWGLTAYTQWPLMTALKHLAALVSCDWASTAGLAPSVRGHPGYWPGHDPDDDGVACE